MLPSQHDGCFAWIYKGLGHHWVGISLPLHKGLLKCSSHLMNGCGLSRVGATATAGMAMAVLAWEGEMDSDL